MIPEYIILAGALIAAIVAIVVALYALHWALDKWGYPSAIRAFKQLGLPEPVEAEAIGISFKRRKA